MSGGTASFIMNLSSSFVIGTFPLKKTQKSCRREFPVGREGGTLARWHENKRSGTACSLVCPARWCKSFALAGSKVTLKWNAGVYRAHHALRLSMGITNGAAVKAPDATSLLTRSGRSWRAGVSQPAQGSARPLLRGCSVTWGGSAPCGRRNSPALQHEL